MQPACRLADLLAQPHLDVQMDVFEVVAEREVAALDLVADLFEPAHDRFSVVAGDDALLREHARVGNRAGDIVTVQAAVVGDRRAVLQSARNRGHALSDCQRIYPSP